MSAAVLYKTKNKTTTTKKTPEHRAAFSNTVEPLHNDHLRDRRSGSRCKEVAVVERFKQESRGAIHSTKIPTGPTRKIGPPQ